MTQALLIASMIIFSFLLGIFGSWKMFKDRYNEKIIEIERQYNKKLKNAMYGKIATKIRIEDEIKDSEQNDI